MLRRLLVITVAAGALMLSAGTGYLAADWPFLHRLWQLPAGQVAWREVVPAPFAAFDGGGSSFFPLAEEGRQTIDPGALAEAAAWAESHGSDALLVLHRGVLQLERYWRGVTRNSLYPVLGASRSLLGIACGRALAEGRIDSLDSPVGRWLDEWRDDPRGSITLRQLLWNVSGLEVPQVVRWTDLLGRGGRLLYGTDFERAALAFPQLHEAGTHFALSAVDAELLSLVIERATGMRYDRYIAQAVWAAVGAGRAEFALDRRGGRAAAFDGLRAAPGDLLRLGALLAGGQGLAARVSLPADWAAQMARGSVPNPQYGLDAWKISGRGLRLSGDGRAVWVFPDEQLVIVRLGDAVPGWDSMQLPDLLRRGSSP